MSDFTLVKLFLALSTVGYRVWDYYRNALFFSSIPSLAAFSAHKLNMSFLELFSTKFNKVNYSTDVAETQINMLAVL